MFDQHQAKSQIKVIAQDDMEKRYFRTGLLDAPAIMEQALNIVQQEDLIVIQVNGKRLLGNTLSFEGRARCMRVVYAFISGEVPENSINVLIILGLTFQ